MKRIIALSTILGALLTAISFSIPAAADGKPAAIVMSVQGDIMIQRGGKQKAIKGKFPLQWNDTVVVGKGGSAVVLFGNGKKVTATSNLVITEAASKIDGKKTSSGVADMVAKSVSGGGGDADLKAKGGVAGAVRAAGDAPTVQILSFLNTNVTSDRPVFAFRPSAPAQSCSVSLMNEDGEKIWSADTKENIAAWPKDSDPLEKGMEYTVDVQCAIDGARVGSSSTFYLLGKEEAAKIDESRAAIEKEYPADDDIAIRHMLLGGFYKEKELYMQALEEYEKLAALDPYDTMSLNEIAAINFKIGNKDDAKKALKKVEEIEKEIGVADGGF